MTQTSTARPALEAALAEARSSRPEAGLALLEETLATSSGTEDPRALARLARNAAILSTALGDLERAAEHYREALRHDPGDGYLRLALADAEQRLGRPERARELLAECREAATAAGDEELLAVVRRLDGAAG